MVALMQTATSLPIFLLALPAGALADIVDRRRLLVAAQVWMLVASFMLGLLTLTRITTPWLLVGITFALGLGSALTMPAWQAIIPEMVPRSQLVAAVQGPVLVTVEYTIDPVRSRDFIHEMHVLRTLRLRDGATNWWLFSDTAKEGHYLECFLVESWIEHLRQHERVTKADLEVENRIRAFHVDAEPPRVSQLLYEPETLTTERPG